MTVRVSVADNCETREIFVSGIQGDAELVIFLEPVLERAENYSSHPTFSRLSMSTEKLGHTLIVRRRARGEAGGRSLACALDTDDFCFDTSRETAFGRGGLYSALNKPSSSSLGDVLDPCILIRRSFTLSPAGFKLNLSLSVADRTSDAVQAAERCLNARAEGKSAVNKTAESLDLNSSDLKIAMEYLSCLAFPGAGASMSKSGFDTLWRYGISGDFL